MCKQCFVQVYQCGVEYKCFQLVIFYVFVYCFGSVFVVMDCLYYVFLRCVELVFYQYVSSDQNCEYDDQIGDLGFYIVDFVYWMGNVGNIVCVVCQCWFGFNDQLDDFGNID